MHNLYFVVLKKNELYEEEAVIFANALLEEHGFACPEGSYWGGGKDGCDWFVIGGRWSGVLSLLNGDITEDELREQRGAKLWGYDASPDDAMKLTPKLRKAIAKKYKGEDVEWFDAEDYQEFWTKDLESREDLDGRWIVVVDFHN